MQVYLRRKKIHCSKTNEFFSINLSVSAQDAFATPWFYFWYYWTIAAFFCCDRKSWEFSEKWKFLELGFTFSQKGFPKPALPEGDENGTSSNKCRWTEKALRRSRRSFKKVRERAIKTCSMLSFLTRGKHCLRVLNYHMLSLAYVKGYIGCKWWAGDHALLYEWNRPTCVLWTGSMEGFGQKVVFAKHVIGWNALLTAC